MYTLLVGNILLNTFLLAAHTLRAAVLLPD